MKNRSKILSKVGVGLLASSMLLAACSNWGRLDLDYEAVQEVNAG